MTTRSHTIKRVLSFIMALAMVLTLLPTAVFAADNPTTLYLKPNSNWLADNARFAAYFFGNGETWVSMTDADGDGYYEVTAPEGYPNVIFCRMNPGTTDNNWDNKWNQSSDLTVPTDVNTCYTVADGAWDKGDGSWSHAVHTYAATVTAPSCTNGGYTTYTCACGDTYTGDETAASGHQYEEGNCTVCGAEDPDYIAPVESKVLYLKPNANWLADNARFAAYFFGNGEAWVSMTDTDGDGYYEVTVPEGYPSVIFCRMNPSASDNNWNNKWNQSSDLTVPTDDNNCYTVAEGAWDKGDGSWSVYTPSTGGDTDPTDPEPTDPTPSEPEESDTVTVYFRNDWLWTSIYIYAWDNSDSPLIGAWPGKEMTYVETLDGKDIYSAEIPADTANFKFSGIKNDNSGTRDESPNLTDPDGSVVYYMHWDNGNQCKTESYTPGGDEGDEPTPAATYIIAGANTDVFGTAWDVANTANAMTLNAETGLYEKTYESVPAGSLTFKVTDGTWDNAWPSENYVHTLDAISDVTIRFNASTHAIIVEATPTGEVQEPVTEVTIHFRNTGLWEAVNGYAWDLATEAAYNGQWPGTALTENAEHTNWYTLSLTELNAASGVGFVFNNGTSQTGDIKITQNGEYWYDGSLPLLTEAPGTWADGSVQTVKYEATFHFANSLKWSTVNLYTWTADESNPTGSWPGTAMNMSDGFYTLTASYEAPEGQGLNFIFNNGSTQTTDLALDASAFTLDGDVYKAEKWVALTTTNSEGKYNADIVDHPGAIAFSPVVDGTSVTFQYKGAATDTVELRGDMNNWESGYAMTCNDYGVWTVTVDNIAYGVHEYKFLVNGNWITDPLNGWTQNDNSAFLISNPEADTNTVTVNVHYTRADGNYDNWNVYAWGTGLADQFDFDENHVATITLDGRATQYICFKVRKSVGTNDWVDQSNEVRVDLSTIVSGTIDVYVTAEGTSWATSQELNADVVTANKISSVELDYDKGTVVITTTQPVSDPSTAFSIDGVTVTAVSVSGNTYTLTLSEVLDLVTLYQHPVNFSEQVKFTEYNYAIGINTVYASDKFAAEFTYTGDDLGCTYTPASGSAAFRVWAPTAEAVTLNLYTSGTPGEGTAVPMPMTKDVNGTWVAYWTGSTLEGRYYTYSVTRNGETVEACDPYARATGVNGQRAMIIDLDSTDPENWDKDSNPNPITSYTDAIIYELHVRDFSIDDSSGVSEANRGKYLAFTEEGTTTSAGVSTGIDYLDELGITHLHLLPIYDYGSVDETTSNSFNWGYDPVNYNVPEGSYSTNPHDGAVRVSEMKQMVQSLHEHDISVIMDVVYNHVYDSGKFCFNQIVPGYFSRVNSNTSGCGNDTASEREMVRKYIVESVLYWTEEYHIDGFRFDLVGLLDVETINQIVTEVHNIRPDVIFYGEGWDMDGTNKEPGTEMAKQHNASKTPGFAYFSDSIRNLIAGSNGSSTGFVSGSTGREAEVAENFLAQPTSWGSTWTRNPQQVVQYASCHDNYTLIDKLIISTGKSAIDDDIIKMNNLSAAIYMTAQGIPFIHAGEEMLREKLEEDGSRCENSYNASDYVNHIEWSNLEKEEYADTSDYYQGLIAFRKAHAGLRLDTAAKIASYVTYTPVTNEVVMFTIDGKAAGDISDKIVVIFNATKNVQEVTLPEGEWNICINSTTAGTESLGTVTSTASVAGISALVLVQGETCAHDWENATCTEPKTCILCGKTEDAAAGHIPGEAVKENVVDSTCSAEGFYDEVVYCTECKQELSRNTRNTDKIDHTPGEAVKENLVNATCSAEGSYDEVIYCTECKQQLSRDIKATPKLAHSYKDGLCTVCGTADPDYAAPAEDGVIRIAGTSRSRTAYKAADELKEVLGIEKFDTIILASGDNFADALAGSYLAAVKKAPILLYRPNALQENTTYITDNLANGGKVYILGGTASVSQEMEDTLTNSGIKVERLAGSSRYYTNLAILKEAGVNGDEILVTTALNFADSLSASATGLPILLVNSNSNKLTDAQITFLKEVKGAKLTIIGGTSSVSQELAEALSAYGTVERVSGPSREKTSVAVAERYFPDADCAMVAYSRNYPDGLCGGPLAYILGAPLLLTDVGKEAPAQVFVETQGITRGIALGGPASIADEVVRTVFGMEADDPITVK